MSDLSGDRLHDLELALERPDEEAALDGVDRVDEHHSRDPAVGDGADLGFAEDLDHVAEELAGERMLHRARRLVDGVALADLERLRSPVILT